MRGRYRWFLATPYGRLLKKSSLMSIQFSQAPLHIRPPHKSEMRTQFGAICYRIVKDRPQVLLITSRGSQRWIIPKGWPIEDVTPSEAAATEAWEEAGVRGRIIDQCIGLYSYFKEMPNDQSLPCAVLVFPFKVKALAEAYPEAGQRKRRWFSPKKAAARVEEPELKHILRNFEPSLLRR